jgi:hypothetical protein
MFTALTTFSAFGEVSQADNKFGPQKADQKTDQQQGRAQIGAFIREIQSGQLKAANIQQTIAALRNQITENEVKLTASDQEVVDVIERFIGFLTDQKNLGHAELLLEFVPDDQKAKFDEKIRDIFPLIRKYDESLDRFKDVSGKLDTLQDRLKELESKEDLKVLSEKKERLVKEYEQMNAQNEQIVSQQLARNQGLSAIKKDLEAARLKKSQLKRDIDDLSEKIKVNDEKLKADDVNKKQAKILNSKTSGLTQKERERISAEYKMNTAAIDQKKNKLEAVKKEIDILVKQANFSGKQKTVSLHDSLSKKLDEIGRVQTDLNKLDYNLKVLKKEEENLRKKQEEQSKEISPLKDELIEVFQDIINMLKGLPITQSNADFGVADRIVKEAQEKFPPSAESGQGVGSSSESSLKNSAAGDSSAILGGDDLLQTKALVPITELSLKEDKGPSTDNNSTQDVSSAQPSKSFSSVVRQQIPVVSVAKAFSASGVLKSGQQKQSPGGDANQPQEKAVSLNTSAVNSAPVAMMQREIFPATAKTFVDQMNNLKATSKNKPIINVDAQKRCVAAAKIIVKSPQLDQRNLLNFLNENKAFMGITHRAVASHTISKIMAKLPLSRSETIEKKLIDALCR